MTTFEVVTVTSVRVCTGVFYIAAPGGPSVEVSKDCSNDVEVKSATIVDGGPCKDKIAVSKVVADEVSVDNGAFSAENASAA